ncbi:alpha/beta fold hydrolase [Nocardia sp. CA-119907]|uniref:alpha/beta fold hydrolase n=1 Tax=Nocardia sp. CA-119907 TaxID=3239973 RepID=UPI003D9845E8
MIEDPYSDHALARSLPGAFRSATAQVNGTRLHYVAGGRGYPLVLLPGWPQTWWHARKIMPILAERYRVIVVELRGMGGSATPATGYDKKTMAADVAALIRELGYDRVNLAGHDIGSMVAFSLAANYPTLVRKLAMLEEPHPDRHLYDLTLLPEPGRERLQRWWFAFNQVELLPEQLLAGRARHLIDFLCARNLRNPNAIGDFDREIYSRAYSRPEAIRAAGSWYRTFGRDIADLATYPQVTTPIAALHFPGHTDLLTSLADTATTFQSSEIPDTGHYLAEEQPERVAETLAAFFG